MPSDAEIAPSDPLLTTDESGRFLGDTPTSTLEYWRTKGEGPRFVKVGRRVYYRRSDLEAYLEANRFSSTAAAKAAHAAA